ncbi:hypothetical protein KKC91_11205 [bacterium]|nr:hypothetical protein [bacterium]MBU1912867.1 hypothetical protein [Candidatus Omnitrophota bacterium]
MKERYKFLRFLVIFLCLSIIGCASIPKGFLKPNETTLERRQLQIRQYDTTNEEQILAAVAGVLQDLGFTLDNSETKLGFVAASKKADAKSGGQMTAAFFLDMLDALGGRKGQNMAQCDKEQVVKASLITKPSLDGSKIVVRVTFQRVVWNMNNQISRVESINEPEIYQKFYDSLSKAIFLEAQKI